MPLNMLLKKSVNNFQIEAENLRANLEQWAAYESKANCVVLAGPGSGKTKVLTTKLARMLAEDVLPPRGIACITFSTQCAKELKKRLGKIGIGENTNVFIGTVHSFCLYHVVIPYAKLAGLSIPDPIKVATREEQKSMFQTAVSQTLPDENPNYLRTRFDAFRKTALNRQSPNWINNDFTKLADLYESLLLKEGLLDFDGMILHALFLIKGYKWVRKILNAKFPILVVDEYQDLGVPLHEIVQQLCVQGNTRLFAVGDPDQSIYGFTGAQPQLLKALANHKNMEKIQLRMNYRCAQNIIKGSIAVLNENREFQSANTQQGVILEHKIETGAEAQIQHIIKLIPEVIARREGRNPGDIAILYQTKDDGEIIAQALDKTKYKYVRFDQAAPYQRNPLTIWLEDCAAWCAGGWKTNSPKLSELLQIWQSFMRHQNNETNMIACRKVLIQFLFNHRSGELKLSDWIQSFVDNDLYHLLQSEPTMRDDLVEIDKINELSRNENNRLFHYTVFSLGSQRGSPEHLNLTTYHSSKGLEYDVVFMPFLEQGKFPNDRSKDTRESRRTFYVAMTRARHEVHFLWSGFFLKNNWGIHKEHKEGRSEFIDDVMSKIQK
jgi:superfamily I DNA/RNA helicase